MFLPAGMAANIEIQPLYEKKVRSQYSVENGLSHVEQGGHSISLAFIFATALFSGRLHVFQLLAKYFPVRFESNGEACYNIL